MGQSPICRNILYVSTTFNRISWLLSEHNIKSVGQPLKKIPSFLRPLKDDLGLKTPGVYSVPCEYSQFYIGQTGRSIQTRIKGHHRHISVEQPDKSAVAEHSINLGHRIKLHDTTVLSAKSTNTDQMIWEAIEIELCRNNMNRKTAFVSAGHGNRSSTLSGDAGSTGYSVARTRLGH
jgi:hypothetical protein